jgi:sugar phosphate isomerase/epimerase
VRDDCAKDFPGVLKAVAKMGFSGVEFAGYYGRSAQELRHMLDEDHLKCYGSHVQLNDLLGDNLDKTVEYNRVLGNKLVVVPSIPDQRRNSRAALLETCKLFNELAKKLEQHGMMLAYHDHAGDFSRIDGEFVWDTIFGNTDSAVRIQFDTGNALQGGVQAAPFLTKFPGRVVSVHVKDFSATNPNALLGEGDVHWNEVLPILKGKNGPRWFIIEQESYPFPPLECAEKCLRTFEKMMGIGP